MFTHIKMLRNTISTSIKVTKICLKNSKCHECGSSFKKSYIKILNDIYNTGPSNGTSHSFINKEKVHQFPSEDFEHLQRRNRYEENRSHIPF